MSEDVVLQRGKGMLHRRSSQSHHFRGRSLLHALERVFVQMTRDETLPAVRTAHLQGTGTADFRFRCIVHSTIFAGELFACQCLVRWTAEGVRLLVVVELVAVEQRAISLVVDRARHRDVRHDALRFTSLGLLTIGVTRVRHHVQRFRMSQRLEGRLGHRQQKAIITSCIRDFMRHNQCVLGIHRRLHVVGGSMSTAHAHKPCFRLRIVLQFLQRCLPPGTSNHPPPLCRPSLNPPSAPSVPTPPLLPLPPGYASVGTRRSTCSRAANVPTATSLPRCAGTRPPAAATTAPAADTRTGTASADHADRSPVVPSPPARHAQSPASPCSTAQRTPP